MSILNGKKVIIIGDRDGEDDLFVIKVPKGSHSGAFIKSVSEFITF